MEDKKTPLYDEHVAAGGRMVPFAGWVMPVQYEGINAEHATVRENVGLFDVSHMGEARVKGPGALETVNRLITNDLNRIKDGRAMYTALCNEDGKIVDDLIVYRLSEDEIFICMNASNVEADFAHMTGRATGDAVWTNESEDWAQIAVQGPNALELLGRLFGDEVSEMRPFRVKEVGFDDASLYVATTGYTGEAGAELYVPAGHAPALWQRLLAEGDDLGVAPIGLGARDTLRLEMAYCLYGNDIDLTTNPLEAGLGWVTRLQKEEFTGRDALLQQKEEGVERCLVGLEVFERGIPRHGYPVMKGDVVVGEITSGTRSPSTGRSIGLGYVTKEHAEEGTELSVDCRGRIRPAKVVKTPFYTRGG
jgi:aminomethyltransferase